MGFLKRHREVLVGLGKPGAAARVTRCAGAQATENAAHLHAHAPDRLEGRPQAVHVGVAPGLRQLTGTRGCATGSVSIGGERLAVLEQKHAAGEGFGIEAIDFGYEAICELIKAQQGLLKDLGIEQVKPEAPEEDTTVPAYRSLA